MTIANIARKNGPFVAAAGETTFPYSFRIFTTDQILVFQNDTSVNAALFTVTGVDSDTGGNVIFNNGLAGGEIVWIFGDTTKEQPTDYPPAGPFPALSHETGLDRSIMVLWEFEEELERRPALKPSTLTALRNLEFPQPGANELIGWNSAGDALTLFESTIRTVTPLAGGGARVEAQTTVAVPAVAANTLVAVGIVPSGALLKALLTHNSAAFGVTSGLSGYSLGTVSAPERFGRNIPVTLLAENNPGQWRNYVQEPANSALDAILTAETGPFDTDGTAIVTAVYDVYVNPTVVP